MQLTASILAQDAPQVCPYGARAVCNLQGVADDWGIFFLPGNDARQRALSKVIRWAEHAPGASSREKQIFGNTNKETERREL
ncbi:MAG: hypothetical protein PHI97_08520 [Desulfobulbus sp.]|nr:hypothetical protein [Desulfobulbus sp.]